MKKFAIILIAAFVFFGCQDKNDTSDTKQLENKAKPQVKEKTVNAEADVIKITNAWVRPAAKNRNTGIFFNVVNKTDQKVTLFEAKSNVAEKTQIHETFKKSNDMMGMREVEYIVVEPKEIFQFKPMSYHVMLINLNEDLTEGMSVELTIVYNNGDEITFTAPVKDNMPSIRAADKKDMQM